MTKTFYPQPECGPVQPGDKHVFIRWSECIAAPVSLRGTASARRDCLVGGRQPDPRLLQPAIEIYKPAYLFNSSGGAATRPSISSAPSSISWGNAFTVQTPDAASISSAVLVRNGAVTHAFDMDQRLVGMSFTAG